MFPRVLEQVEEGAFVIDRLASDAEMLAHSETESGSFFRTSTGYTKRLGSTTEYYVCQEYLAGMLESRVQVQELLGAEAPLTWGAQSRSVHKWMQANPPYSESDLRFMASLNDPWHYQYCRPHIRRTLDGDMPIEYVKMVDIEGAYWQMLERMPSPLVTLNPRGAQFHYARSRFRRQWERLKEIVKICPKPFRLVFVGTAVSAINPRAVIMYHGGKKTEIWLQSPYPTTGACSLAIRATYEVVQMQAQALRTNYANVDCVTIKERDAEPEIWRELGIRYRVRAEGAGEMRAVGFWQIGDERTEHMRLLGTDPHFPQSWYNRHESPLKETIYHTFLRRYALGR